MIISLPRSFSDFVFTMLKSNFRDAYFTMKSLKYTKVIHNRIVMFVNQKFWAMSGSDYSFVIQNIRFILLCIDVFERNAFNKFQDNEALKLMSMIITY